MDMIDAYIDGEIKDELLEKEILARINNDNNFAIEYRVHSLVKNLIKEKVVYQQTPLKVRAKILKSIGSTTKVNSEKRSFFADIFERAIILVCNSIGSRSCDRINNYKQTWNS
ncbi:MAG: hypothetical protein MZV64_39970 [Ignavibacteriales bacterium]|nr:hypothetical protein [Ignavibacteriales bacterium]